MEFLSQYGLFLLETLTITLAVIIIIAAAVGIAGKDKMKENLKITDLSKQLKEIREKMEEAMLSKKELKTRKKEIKLKKKAEKKTKKNDPTPGSGLALGNINKEERKKKVFVLDFHGDIKASQVTSLREEITSLLTIATPKDEVVVRLESAGGMVHSYGLASSQLQRIRNKNIPLTIIIDKVAASGGYMMACVANKILAAPFAIVGSVGVVAQIPNFHRWLKKKDIDFEQVTAGEYKRTLTMFGENTPKGREKFQEDMEKVHHLFKDFIVKNRPQIDIEEVATGEHWHALDALNLKLVDEIATSDDYLMKLSKDAKVHHIKYKIPKKKVEKILSHAQNAIYNLLHGEQT